MISYKNSQKSIPQLHKLLMPFLVLLLLTSLVSCNLLSSDNSDDDSLKETQIALGIQQTSLAEKELGGTQESLQATQDALAGGAGSVPTPDLEATQIALSVQQTMAASGGGDAPPVATDPPAVPTEPPATSPPNVDFNTLMKSAKILLYEDIVNDPTESRYAEKTLKAMGLNYKDDGSAKGWLKNDMLGGSPQGGPWDLIIMAIETRGQVSGEYFEYLNDVLNQGTSVILEAWHLDQISSGTISTILAKCGVQVYPYFPKTGQSLDVVVWPVSGAASHPILSDPNSGMSFTRARTKWIPSGDLGDLVALTGSGDAAILMGTKASERNRDGVLTSCMNGQLTLMTFSSHSFEYQTMYPLWENMIYNALKTRLLGPQ